MHVQKELWATYGTDCCCCHCSPCPLDMLNWPCWSDTGHRVLDSSVGNEYSTQCTRWPHDKERGFKSRGPSVQECPLSLFLPLTSDTAWRFNLAEADYHFGFFFGFFFHFGVQCVCRSALLHDRSIRVLKFVRVCGRIDCIDYPFGWFFLSVHSFCSENLLVIFWWKNDVASYFVARRVNEICLLSLISAFKNANYDESYLNFCVSVFLRDQDSDWVEDIISSFYIKSKLFYFAL